MKKIKKILRLIGLILLILLASIGIGLGGGMPIPLTGRREEMSPDITIEQVDKKEETEEKDKLELKF